MLSTWGNIIYSFELYFYKLDTLHIPLNAESEWVWLLSEKYWYIFLYSYFRIVTFLIYFQLKTESKYILKHIRNGNSLLAIRQTRRWAARVTNFWLVGNILSPIFLQNILLCYKFCWVLYQFFIENS